MEFFYALIMTMILYGLATTTVYEDYASIQESLADDSMSYIEGGEILGTGGDGSTVGKNFHIACHNDRPWVLAKTNLTYVEFTKRTPNMTFPINRVEMRRLLVDYVSDKIRYSDYSTEKLLLFRDYQRNYFAHKGVKDFIILSGKREFGKVDVAKMFRTNSLLNYMNDLYLNAMD